MKLSSLNQACLSNANSIQRQELTSPSNIFTPRFFGFESRPFFVDPAVFLVAQRLSIKLSPPADPSKPQ